MNNLINFSKKMVIFMVSISLIIIPFILIAGGLACPLIREKCAVEPDITEAFRSSDGNYYVHAKPVPFSCYQVCSTRDYYSKLMIVILTKILVPVIIIYFISCTFLFIVKKIKRL